MSEQRQGPARRHTLGLSGLAMTSLILAIVVLASLVAPASNTEARWHSQAVSQLPSTQSDTFSLEATASTVPLQTGQSSNTPQVSAALNSNAQNGLLDVRTSTLSAPAGIGAAALLANSTVRYAVAGPGQDCTQNPANYWSLGGPGELALGATYDRDASPMQSVQPGGTRQVCPQVEPDYGTQRALHLAHAGRVIDLETNLRLATADPASWLTGTESVTTRYRVDFPRIRPGQELEEDDNRYCFDDTFLGIGSAGVRWAWPDSATDSSTTSPAIDRWQIRYRPSGGSWSEPAGLKFNGSTREVSARTVTGAISLSNSSFSDFAIRAYPFAHSDTYIDTAVFEARRRSLSRQIICGDAAEGPNEQVNLP